MVGAFPFPSFQGTQVYAQGMARALRRAGIDLRLATYAYGAGAWPDDLPRVEVARVPGAGSLRSGPSLGKLALDAALVGACVRALPEVDLVHAHHAEAALVARAAMGGRRVPLVYNLHTSLGEELPVYLPAAVGPLAAAAGAGLDRLLVRLADACVAPSARGAALLGAWGARRALGVLPGVDPTELRGGDAARARAAWRLGEGPWVLYAGNADAYQDLDVLLEAMARVPEAGLLALSAAPFDAFAAPARRAGLPEARLRVTGAADLPALRDALAVAALAAVPRTVCAGFPMKLLNQLAAGVPTVVARGSAQPIDGQRVVPDHDPAAMAAAIRQLLADPPAAARLGAAGAAAVSAGHTWDVAVRPLLALYGELLGR